MKRAILLAAALTLGLTSAAYGASFADIDDVPWAGAKEYINNVADAGLMVGDRNTAGKTVFRAKDRVTYCETTQLAYALLQNTGNLKSGVGSVSKWEAVMQGYKIPGWAYNSVAYALDTNVVSVADISKFMKSASENNYASREDVAVIFGKTLSALYSTNANAALSFADKDKIAKTSVPYVDLLARLNIMVGDDDNNFRPRNYINRAEMAVVMSKTNSSLKGNGGSGGGQTTKPEEPAAPANANEVRGVVVRIDDMGSTRLLTLTIEGKNKGFIGDSTTNVIYSDKQVGISAVGVGDNITVNYDGSKINKLTINSSLLGISTTTVEGKIDEVTNERIYINKSSGGTADYYFAGNIEITIDGDKSSVKDLVDAVNDGVVDVTVSVNARDEASIITAKKNTRATVSGEIISLSSSEIEIQKLAGSRGKTRYDIDDDATIKIDSKSSTISNIKSKMKDDTMYATLSFNSKGDVKTLVASEDKPKSDGSSSSSSDDTVKGTLYDLTSSEIQVKKSGSSSKKTYDLASSVKYYLDGSSSSRSEIQDELKKYEKRSKDLYVTLTLKSNGDVSKIEVFYKEQDDDDDADGYITSIDSKSIKIKTSSGKTKEYDFVDRDADEVSIKIDSKSNRTYRDLRDAVDEYSKVNVTLTLKSGEVSKIVATTSNKSSSKSDDYDGEITRLSETKLCLDGKSSTFYKIDNKGKDIDVKVEDGRNSTITTFSKLLAAYEDDKKMDVTITVDRDNIVTDIEGQVIEAEGVLTSIDIDERYIWVESDGGNKTKYTYKSSVDITVDGDDQDEKYLDKHITYDFDVKVKFDSSNYVKSIEAEE